MDDKSLRHFSPCESLTNHGLFPHGNERGGTHRAITDAFDVLNATGFGSTSSIRGSGLVNVKLSRGHWKNGGGGGGDSAGKARGTGCACVQGSQPCFVENRLCVGGGGGIADMLKQVSRTNPHKDRANHLSTPSKSYEALQVEREDPT